MHKNFIECLVVILMVFILTDVNAETPAKSSTIDYVGDRISFEVNVPATIDTLDTPAASTPTTPAAPTAATVCIPAHTDLRVIADEANGDIQVKVIRRFYNIPGHLFGSDATLKVSNLVSGCEGYNIKNTIQYIDPNKSMTIKS